MFFMTCQLMVKAVYNNKPGFTFVIGHDIKYGNRDCRCMQGIPLAEKHE